MPEIQELLAAIAALTNKAQTELAAGDMETWERTMRELKRLEYRRDREWERLAARRDAVLRPAPTGSAREQVRAVLGALAVPAAPSLISTYHAARFGEEIPYKALTSTRFDDQRSYERSPKARLWYVVPALTFDFYSPVRGLLALSEWDLADRIVAPLTARTSHLKITQKLADEVAAARHREDPYSTALERLLWRFARSLPGAPPDDLDPATVRELAGKELAVLDEQDTAERRRAEARARAQLDERDQLFGIKVRSIGGTSRTGRNRRTRGGHSG
jgi:hypothetical protein